MTKNNQHKKTNNETRELDTLISGLLLNQLNKADKAHLCRLLAESEEARWAYIHAVHLDEGVKRWSQSQGEADIWAVVDLLRQSDDARDEEMATQLEYFAVDDALSAREYPASQQFGAARRRSKVFWPKLSRENSTQGTRTWLAIAVSLLVAVAVWQSMRQENVGPSSAEETHLENMASDEDVVVAIADSEKVVARVTSTTGDLVWTRGREPKDFLMRFCPGDIVGVAQGLFQIEFSAGASLVVEAPAVLQVTSATSARLSFGRVVGRADRGNFTLLTPTANVVDIGTEFGVGVSDNGTDVTVFEGEVHVHSLAAHIDPKSMQKLQEGMSARIDSRGLSYRRQLPNQEQFQRNFGRHDKLALEKNSVSLLDLVSGHDTNQPHIAGSIDPTTGYWGRPPWLEAQRTKAQRGDTQFAQTDWNPMVDGVFIPRSNAREMQIDSDGHMVYLPPNNGSTWGPIWARRNFDLNSEQDALSSSQNYWEAGALSRVLKRLQQSREGLMGLHANVGITFNLEAVRESRSQELNYFKAIVANLNRSFSEDSPATDAVADLRVFVDGKLRYSRLQFSHSDGDADIHIALSTEDRFLTIVTTDAGVDPAFDHVVLIDPVLEFQPPPPDSQPDQA